MMTGQHVVSESTGYLARLPPAPTPPPIIPDLHSGDPYSVAAALQHLPSSLQGQLKLFAFTGEDGAAGRNWKRRATADPDALAEWAAQFPGAGVGVRTGVAGGLVVLKVRGGRGFGTLVRLLGAPPSPTVEMISEHGTRYLFYRLNPSCIACPTRNDLAPGVSLIGDGGHVRLAPMAATWFSHLDDPSGEVDFRTFPAAWLRYVAKPPGEIAPSVRFF